MVVETKFLIFIVALIGFHSLISPVQAQSSPIKEPTQATGTNLSITVRGQKMNANIIAVKLGEVLKEFSRETGIKITVTEARAKELITINFRELPIDEGVQRILKSNYTLTYGSATSAKENEEPVNLALLNEIQVLNAVSANKRVIAREKQEVFKFNPQKLAERVLTFGDEPGRIEIMERIQREALEVNINQLQDLAASDKSIHVRQLAIEEMTNRLKPKAAETFLQKTIQNESAPEVKAFVENILNSIKEENAWLYKN